MALGESLTDRGLRDKFDPSMRQRKPRLKWFNVFFNIAQHTDGHTAQNTTEKIRMKERTNFPRSWTFDRPRVFFYSILYRLNRGCRVDGGVVSGEQRSGLRYLGDKGYPVPADFADAPRRPAGWNLASPRLGRIHSSSGELKHTDSTKPIQRGT